MLWLIPILLLAFIIIFGDSPSFRNTPIQSSRQKLLLLNTYILNHLGSVNIPPWTYYSIPLFYLTVITVCLGQFFHKTWSILPLTITTSLFHQCYIAITILSVVALTFISTFSDPGNITKYNVHHINSQFVNNEIIYFSHNICSTCDLVKPARSKHCSTCDRCVALFDHHCIWINNCVGLYNYKYFMGWLVANINFLVYGDYLCMQAMPWRGFWTAVKADDAHKITGIFVILCSLFSLIVALFTGLQLRYIYLGITTNELDKWGEIEHLVEIGTLYRRNSQYFERVGNQVINMQNTQTFVFEDMVKVESMEEIDNVYDKGFVRNLRERL